MRKQWKNAFGKKVYEGFFSESEIDSLLSLITELENEEDRRDYVWKYYEQGSTATSRIEYFVNYNKDLNNLANDDRIIQKVRDLMGEEPILFKDKINFKYPAGEGFSLHQDISAGWGMYSNVHITFAIPLCDTTKENGCILFGNAETEQLTPNFQDLPNDFELFECPTAKGDVIAFDSYIPHASYENKTSLPRPVLFLTYTPESYGDFYEQYHKDKFENVPPDIYKVKGKKYRSGNSNSAEKEFK
jgi:ectoine hydroxylase-related dioxygenase (phytanoyl-CoA dioxygenase family)